MDSKINTRVGIGTARKALMKVKQNALMKVKRYAMLEALMKGERNTMMMKPLMKVNSFISHCYRVKQNVFPH